MHSSRINYIHTADFLGRQHETGELTKLSSQMNNIYCTLMDQRVLQKSGGLKLDECNDTNYSKTPE